jgi:hypothetical protein
VSEFRSFVRVMQTAANARASWEITRPSSSAHRRRLATVAMLVSGIVGCSQDTSWQRIYLVRPHETETFNYRAAGGQVFSFAVQQGPEMPEDQVGLKFGWAEQRLFCTGKNCAHASGWLLFCPVRGSITGELNNLSDSEFQITVRRIQCDGADAGTMQCPTASTLHAMCGGK